MSTLVLGREPATITLLLDPDADFVARLEPATVGQTFDTSAVIEIVFENGGTWPAEVTENSVSWNVPQTEVASKAALQRGRPWRLRYISGDVTLTWAKGRVERV